MSTLGKVFAALNIVAAVAFVSLAAMDWGHRYAWRYSVFRHDLAIKGLPVDGQEKNLDGIPVVDLLTDKTLQEVFQGAGAPVKTQVEEVKRRQEQLQSELAAADRKTVSLKLSRTLLPLARTRGQRDALAGQIQIGKVNGLLTPDGPFFREALQGKDAKGNDLEQDQRRAAIAHVLVLLSDDAAEMQRAIAVVGLEAASRALDGQALAFGGMDQSVRADTTSRRAEFETSNKQVVQLIEVLASRLADIRNALQHQRDLNARHQTLVAGRQADLTDVTNQLDLAGKATQVELARQSLLEKELFNAERAYGEAMETNQKLERQLRGQELGR